MQFSIFGLGDHGFPIIRPQPGTRYWQLLLSEIVVFQAGNGQILLIP